MARDAWPGALMANSNFQVDWPPEMVAKQLAEGRFDLYAYGRRFLANPDLVPRLAAEAKLKDADFRTFYGGAEGYTDYPALGGVA